MYAFIHIPKTAGSTFRQILRVSFSSRHCDLKAPKAKRAAHAWIDAADLRRSRRVYPRLAGVAGHRVTCFSGLQEAVPGLRFVTFLRDPHRRFCSHFLHSWRGTDRPSTRADFLRFCADPHQRNVQTRWVGGSDDPAAALRAIEENRIFVGLTEDFDASLVLFRDWLGLPRLDIRHLFRNRAPNTPTLNVDADPEMRSAMEEANRADTVLYRHAVEVVFPRQVAAFAGNLADEVARLREQSHRFGPWGESLWARGKRNLVYKPLLHFGLA